MELRDYQREAVDQTFRWLGSAAGNPVIVLPTGAGKSLVIAELCRQAYEWGVKTLVLAHRKELLEQNAAKLKAILPSDVPVGMFSAGLNRRDTFEPVVVAGIQSVYRLGSQIGHRELVIVDESHLVPDTDSGMYRTFLSDWLSIVPRGRLVGLTATPYRLDSGPLCGPGKLWTKVSYHAPVRKLIDDGWLSEVRGCPAAGAVDCSRVQLRGGEFVAGAMERAFDDGEKVRMACREIINFTANRGSVLIFAAGVDHAEHVAAELAKQSGERVGVVTGNTMPLERSKTLEDFRCRRLRWCVNVDVLTTGFDAPNIDAICVLRATMSPGLFAQIVGRGFRTCEGKSDCLLLDFGGNLARHGPLDSPDYGKTCRGKSTGERVGEVPTKVCPACRSEVLAAARECDCGWQFPRELKHETSPDGSSPVLSDQVPPEPPKAWRVERRQFSVHEKKGSPHRTLRIDYFCVPAEAGEAGNLAGETISEWVCVEHDGFARQKAEDWWRQHSATDCPTSAEEACEIALFGEFRKTEEITTTKDGRWFRIVNRKLSDPPDQAEHVEETEEIDEWDSIPF